MEDIRLINRIKKLIEQIIKDKKETKIILFPFGEGVLSKRILNQYYGIKEAFIIDK